MAATVSKWVQCQNTHQWRHGHRELLRLISSSWISDINTVRYHYSYISSSWIYQISTLCDIIIHIYHPPGYIRYQLYAISWFVLSSLLDSLQNNNSVKSLLMIIKIIIYDISYYPPPTIRHHQTVITKHKSDYSHKKQWDTHSPGKRGRLTR